MESSKSDSESPDQAEFRGDNKCAQCMQVLYLQSEQVKGIHNLEDIHIQSSTSTATVLQYYGTGECMGECRGNTTGTVVGLSGTVLILTQKIINSTWRLLIW